MTWLLVGNHNWLWICEPPSPPASFKEWELFQICSFKTSTYGPSFPLQPVAFCCPIKRKHIVVVNQPRNPKSRVVSFPYFCAAGKGAVSHSDWYSANFIINYFVPVQNGVRIHFSFSIYADDYDQIFVFQIKERFTGPTVQWVGGGKNRIIQCRNPIEVRSSLHGVCRYAPTDGGIALNGYRITSIPIEVYPRMHGSKHKPVACTCRDPFQLLTGIRPLNGFAKYIPKVAVIIFHYHRESALYGLKIEYFSIQSTVKGREERPALASYYHDRLSCYFIFYHGDRTVNDRVEMLRRGPGNVRATPYNG